MGKDRCANYIVLFEQLVIMEHLMRQNELLQSDIDILQQYIPILMHHFIVTLQRNEGMGCKFLKFHQIKHLVDDMKRLGSSQNFSTSAYESGHKDNAKFPALTTQRQMETFVPQLERSYVGNIAIDRAYSDINAEIDNKNVHEGISYHGKRFF